MKMFWMEKYVMVAMLTMTIRKLFRWKDATDCWGCGILVTLTVISMNLGAGLLYPLAREQMIFGVAEGVFAGGLLICSRMMCKTVLDGRTTVKQEYFLPGEEKISEYTKAITDLSKTFLSIPVRGKLAVVGLDDYERIQAAWSARMNEQRIAVAAQLTELSQIMEGAVRRAYETKKDEILEKQLRLCLGKKGVMLKSLHIYDNAKGKKEVYLMIRMKRKRCISNKEVAAVLSEVTGCDMMPAHDTRAFVRNEYTNTCFVERTNFEVVYGVERCIGDSQQISGDSFSFMQKEDGQFLASLSDGMGSGLQAYQESEKVVDLLEQFLEAGFSKETAVKMINSALVLASDGKTFSTIDICSIDLYNGMCEFVKVGAAASFIKRASWVETITSTSLPAGIFQMTDLEKTERRLFDGDMLVMVTDGVLNVLPLEHQEKILKDIIMEHQTNNPKELAEYIMGRVRQYKNGRACDDMTILVVGLWQS